MPGRWSWWGTIGRSRSRANDVAVRPDSPPDQRTDGLVSYESAHVAGAASEKIVSAGHLCQDNLEVIGEVRRILAEHAAAH